MSGVRRGAMIVAAVLVPVALSLGTYAIASSRLGISNSVPPVQGVSRDGTPSPTPTPSTEDRKGEDRGSGSTSDRCSEAEHAADPSCGTSTSSGAPTTSAPTSPADDHGGSSKGGSGSDGSGGSGSGSGHGGGDD